MYIQIDSNMFNVIEMFTQPNSYMFRLNKTDDGFEERLRNADTLTIQDGDTSHIVSNYTVGCIVTWDNYVDYEVIFSDNPIAITKTEVDALNEHITNLELALCEIYENMGV